MWYTKYCIYIYIYMCVCVFVVDMQSVLWISTVCAYLFVWFISLCIYDFINAIQYTVYRCRHDIFYDPEKKIKETIDINWLYWPPVVSTTLCATPINLLREICVGASVGSIFPPLALRQSGFKNIQQWCWEKYPKKNLRKKSTKSLSQHNTFGLQGLLCANLAQGFIATSPAHPKPPERPAGAPISARPPCPSTTKLTDQLIFSYKKLQRDRLLTLIISEPYLSQIRLSKLPSPKDEPLTLLRINSMMEGSARNLPSINMKQNHFKGWLQVIIHQ